MGQIANQMALELFFKIKERIKEKRSKNKPIKTMVQRNRQLPVDIALILGNLITVIFDYQILRKPLKILSL